MTNGDVRRTIETPVGPVDLIANDTALVAVLFASDERREGAAPGPPGHPILEQAEAELREYFDGKRRQFSLPLAPRGTLFQRAVWAALNEIPFGVTCSYADIARKVGRPTAVRAVGAANGRNPIAIIVPCHRVVGANGTLTGYAGGLDRKRALLALEGALGQLL